MRIASAVSRSATTSAAAPSEICEALPAVTVPSSRNAARRLPSDSAGRTGPHPLVVLDEDWLAAPLRDLDGDDLLGKGAGFGRGDRTIVARCGPLVLFGATDAQFGVVPVGGLAHEHLVERTHQAVLVERIDEFRSAVAVAETRPVENVRRVRHRLHTAGHHDARFAGSDVHVCISDRCGPGETRLVDRRRRNRHRDAALEGGLPARDLPLAGLDHMPEEHFVDLVPYEPRTFERRSDREATEIHGGEWGEATPEPADRCASDRGDDGGHRNPFVAFGPMLPVAAPSQGGRYSGGSPASVHGAASN